MNALRIVGLLALVSGVILQPIGWMYTHWLTGASFVAIFFGVLLLLHGRQQEGRGGEGGPSPTGREMPGDIHGYSGQMSGGRSTAWESHHHDSSDGGGSID
jgi:hypothetical protein